MTVTKEEGGLKTGLRGHSEGLRRRRMPRRQLGGPCSQLGSPREEGEEIRKKIDKETKCFPIRGSDIGHHPLLSRCA